MKRSRCVCGKVKSKFLHRCKACMDKAHEINTRRAQEVWSGGKCPDCGSGLRRNNALAGWVQCEQYGAENFRARANDPSCNFQCFTQ